MKYHKIFKTFLLFSLIALVLSACEIAWFGDLETDLKSDANSILRFYAQRLEDNPESQCIELSASISDILNVTDFPYEEIDIIKPGYHINYWCYYRDPNNQNSGIPSNIIFDSTIENKVSSIKVTPQYVDFYAVWVPNTDTKYTVEHYFQNLTLDDYEIDNEKTQILTGTTDESTAGNAYTVTGFESKPFEQINIDGDGSAVLKIYYNRCAESIIVDYADGSEPIEFNGYYGQKVEGINIPDRSQQGYDFDYWKIIYEDGTTDVLNNPEIKYTEYKEKYVCIWKEKVYNITWVLEQTNPAVKAQWVSPYKPTESYTVSTGCTMPSAGNITRRGYTFAGWYADSSYITPAADWTNGQTEDKTFYAKWTPVVYTISYEKNGGTISDSAPATYTIEDNIRLPEITKRGNIFMGWYVASDFSGKAVQSWDAGDRNENITFYAKWEEIIYNITWVLEQTNPAVKAQWVSPYKPTENYTVSTGCTMPSAGNITRRGYTFAGWYADSSYTTPAADWTNGQTEDKTFYAKWTPVVYTISYEKNNGIMTSAEPSSYIIEDNVTLPVITRIGWTFNGWFVESDFSGTPVSSWNAGDRNENVTFYAKWTEKTSQISGITITYPVENDAALNLNVEYSKETDIWTYSVASGYTSYQWFYDENQIVSWSGNSGTATSAASGLTLTAGYHNILVVVTDSSGTQYSASAIVQIVK